MAKTTQQKIIALVKDLERNNPAGVGLMYERLLNGADELNKYADQVERENKNTIIHPRLMRDYAERVKKNLEG